MSKTNLIDKYIKLNNSFNRKLTFHLGAEAGFFSEINNLVLCLIYCLDNNIKFTLYSKKGNFSYAEGWNDFFLPFCDQTDFFLHQRYNRRAYQMKNRKKLPPYLLKIFTRNDLLTQDIWDSFRSEEFASKKFTVPKLNLEKASLLETAKTIIPIIWRYKKGTKEIIDGYKQSIILPRDFISIHIRSGDKTLEANTFSIEKYMERANSLNLSRNAFILTDDYSVIENLNKQYTDWNFFSLCSESERGYIHSDFNKKGKIERYHSHLKLLASIDICSESEHFIGTYSSNPGMFMGMRIGEEKCSCLDFDSWVLW